MARSVEVTFDGDLDPLKRKADQFRAEQEKKPLIIPMEIAQRTAEKTGAGGSLTFSREKYADELVRMMRTGEMTTSRFGELSSGKAITQMQNEYNDLQRQTSHQTTLQSKLEDRYAVKYENRLVNDLQRQHTQYEGYRDLHYTTSAKLNAEEDRNAARYQRSSDAASFAAYKRDEKQVEDYKQLQYKTTARMTAQEERRSAQVDSTWDKTDLAKQISEEKAARNENVKSIKLEARVRKEAFEERLQTMKPLAASRALADRAEEVEDSDPAYAQRLKTRSQQAFNNSFFGRPKGRALALQMLFGGWEASRALGDVAMFDNPALNRTDSQKLQTSQDVIKRLGTGIYGSIASGLVSAIDLVQGAGGYRTTELQKALGVQTTPFDFEQATAAAQSGLAKVAAGSAQIQMRNTLNMQSFRTENQTAAMGSYGTSQQKLKANQAYGEAIYGYNIQMGQLQDTASTSDNEEERESARRRLNEMQKNKDRFVGDQEGLRDATLRRIERMSELGNLAMQRMMPELMASTPGESKELQFERQLQDKFVDVQMNDPDQLGTLKTLQAGQRYQHQQEIYSRVQGTRAATVAGEQRLGRKYLEANLTELDEQRRQAQENASPQEQAGIANRFDVAKREMIQQDQDRHKLIGYSQQAKSDQLDALLERNQAKADVAGIVGQDRINIEQYRQQGDLGEARKEGANSLKALALYRQNRMDDFHAEGFSRTYDDISNPKDTEDPKEINKSIDAGVQAIKDILTNLVNNN